MNKAQFDNLRKTRQNCIDHSKDLLNSAKLLRDKNYKNISYHLSTLALEEIGKVAMLTAGYMGSEKKQSIINQAGEDHVKKLFWALWGPTIGKDRITKEQIDTYRGLAKKVHEQRLAGLYVSINIENQISPKDVIPDKELETLINVTDARLSMEEHTDISEPNNQAQSDLEWFHNIANDQEKIKLMFGQKSLDKLCELGRTPEWIRWIREQFEVSEKECREIAEKELNRNMPQEKEKDDPKWEIRFKLISLSHSIRQNVLNNWNEKSLYIKLNIGKQGKKKRELLVDLTLTKRVPIQGLWWAGWTFARRFTVALNIATRGYFWWQVPKDISRYYEKIIDIERKCDVNVERNPKLSIDWGNLTLSENELWDTGLAYTFIPYPTDKEKIEPYNHYVAGISMLAKNDIHVQCEPEVFMQFYHSLRLSMESYGDFKIGDKFSETADNVLSVIAPGLECHRELIQLAEGFETKRKWDKPITLTEAAGMKVICDLYLLQNFRRLAKKRINLEQVENHI